jgi:hypoxanthine phosphoribosyltransferase
VTVPHRLVAGRDDVRRRVRELAADIEASTRATSGARRDGTDAVVLVGVLKGSVPFLADLCRALDVPVRVDFVAVSSYRPGSGRVRLVKDLDLDVTGAPVVLVHDVVHTGLTTAYLVGELRRRGAAAVDVCALVDRRAHRLVPVEVRHAGFRLEGEYVVGMGLDHRGIYRNLDSLVAVDEQRLDAAPEALVGELYGSADRTVAPGQSAPSWR